MIDPVHCMDRHLARFQGAVEFKRLSRRSPDARFLFVHDPAHNRQVLMQQHSLKTAGLWPLAGRPRSAQELLRNNMLNSGNHDLFDDMVNHHFSRKRVVEIFAGIKASTAAEIGEHTFGLCDVHALAKRFAQRNVLTLLFGEQESNRVYALGKLIDDYHNANWSRAAHFFPVDMAWTPYGRAKALAEMLHPAMVDWIEEARNAPPHCNLRSALLDMAGKNDCPVSHVAGTAALLGFAGYGTMASVFAWAVVLLALHPGIMGDLADELSKKPRVNDIDYATLAALPLLDAVVNEVMRLITPAPVLSFRTREPCEVAGLELAANSRILVGAHLTHRTPDIYPAPDRFRPDRWFSIKPSTYEFLPFSGGQRRCPGYWFALTALKVGLATLLERFRAQIPAGARIDRAYAALTVPKRGAPIELLPPHATVRVAPCSGSMFDLFVPEPDRRSIH